MKSSRITWLAFASVATVLGCGDRVLVGQQPSGVGAGATSAGAPPVNQAPPASQTMQPPLPATQAVPGTPPPSCPSTSPAQFVSSSLGVIFSLAYSPDGQSVAGGLELPEPNQLRLWGSADWTVSRSLRGQGLPPDGVTYDIAFSPDSRILATGGIGAPGVEAVKLWEVATGYLLPPIHSHAGASVDALAFSPDGSELVTAGTNGPLEIWRYADGVLLTSIPSSGTVHGVRFSPDGTRILTAQQEQVATIWRVTDGAKLVTLSGHTDEVMDAEFSPDGKEIATSSYDHTVGLWDAASGELLERLTGHSTPLTHVRWIDQDHLASSDWRGTVILWTRDASGAFTSSCSLSTVTASLGLAVSPDRTKLVASGSTDPNSQNPGF